MRRLRLQLIGTLLLVALLPAVPAAVIVHALLERSLDNRLAEVVEESSRAGLAGLRELLGLRREELVSSILDGSFPSLTDAELASLSQRERDTILGMGTAVRETTDVRGERLTFSGPDRVQLEGREVLVSRVTRANGSVWAVDPLPEGWGERAAAMTESVRLVETLKRERSPVVRSLLLTFLVVYGVILFLVAVLGALLASRVTRPLDELARGVARVASGDWDTPVPHSASGTLGSLVAQFNGMMGTLRDQRDDLVRLEKQSAWRNLARRLAHEIKNPLTPIRLAAQQMRDAVRGADVDDRNLVSQGVEIIEEEVGSLEELVREFSQFARLPEPKLTDTSLASVLQSAQVLYGPERVVTRDPGSLMVRCDRDEIHRVLINLINNALQAQEAIGVTHPVQLESVPGKSSTVVRVLDRGPGVPADIRHQVFEPDFSTKTEGMGLGLAIVDGVIRAHGGTVWSEPREGGGSVFAFTLDLVQESESGRSPS